MPRGDPSRKRCAIYTRKSSRRAVHPIARRQERPALSLLRLHCLITEAGTDRAQGWRLPAQEIEEAVIRVLADALNSPAMLVERFGTAGIPSDQTRKMLDRATRLAATLKRSPAERAKVVRDLIEKVVIEENAITMRVRRSPLLGRPVLSRTRATALSRLQRLWPSGAAV